MTARPRIGITAYDTIASWTYWRDVPAALVPGAYVEAVRAVGGLPYVIPAIPEVGEDPRGVLEPLDGLVVVGGPDVTPASYGAEPHGESIGWQEVRDRAELALIAAALEADLPFVGVCRGLQLLNVARGGTLVQHLADVVEEERHRPGLGRYGWHDVDVADGSRLRALVGATVEVMSSHHQAPDRLGTGLRVVGRDSSDDMVEALEDPELSFCIGVQWHPEEDRDGSGLALFQGLVECAAGRRTREEVA